MHVSRFVSLVCKPLLSSFCPRVAPVRWAPCRTITTGQDHVRFGNVGGKMPKHRDLDVLLGRWIYDPDNPHGDQLDPAARAMLPKGQYANFARNNGTWILRTGIKGYGSVISYTFKLNKIFLAEYDDGTVYRAMAQKMGDNGLGFTFCTLLDDSIVFGFTTEVVEDKLFMRSKQIDGTRFNKVYIRD